MVNDHRAHTKKKEAKGIQTEHREFGRKQRVTWTHSHGNTYYASIRYQFHNEITQNAGVHAYEATFVVGIVIDRHTIVDKETGIALATAAVQHLSAITTDNKRTNEDIQLWCGGGGVK